MTWRDRKPEDYAAPVASQTLGLATPRRIAAGLIVSVAFNVLMLFSLFGFSAINSDVSQALVREGAESAKLRELIDQLTQQNGALGDDVRRLQAENLRLQHETEQLRAELEKPKNESTTVPDEDRKD